MPKQSFNTTHLPGSAASAASATPTKFEKKPIVISRKNKLKRIFNYDAEIDFLQSFYNLKFKNMNLDEFEYLVKTALVDTNFVSDVVSDFYIQELKIKETIKNKNIELSVLHSKTEILQSEIKELEKLLDDEEDGNIDNIDDIFGF